MSVMVVSGISFRFRRLSRCEGQIADGLLTRSPLVYPRRGLTAQLACVKHAASVRPEPGSNSPLNSSDNHKPQRAHESSTITWSIPARVPTQKPPKGSKSRRLTKGTTDRYQNKPKRSVSQPADWRYKL